MGSHYPLPVHPYPLSTTHYPLPTIHYPLIPLSWLTNLIAARKQNHLHQRRRERALEDGQFAFSAELNTGIILFAGVAGLVWLAQSLGSGLLTKRVSIWAWCRSATFPPTTPRTS